MCSDLTCSSLRNSHPIIYNDFTNVQSHQQCMKVSFPGILYNSRLLVFLIGRGLLRRQGIPTSGFIFILLQARPEGIISSDQGSKLESGRVVG